MSTVALEKDELGWSGGGARMRQILVSALFALLERPFSLEILRNMSRVTVFKPLACLTMDLGFGEVVERT